MEKRATRNGGVNPNDGRIVWKLIRDYTLHPEHTLKDEIKLYEKFVREVASLQGSVIEKTKLSTSHCSFLLPLVIYSCGYQKTLDSTPWPKGSTTTPTGIVTIIRKHFQTSMIPVTFFIGQPLNIGDAYEHAWAAKVTKTEGVYNMQIKDCLTVSQGAKIPQIAITVAEYLKIKFVELIPSTPEEDISDNECVICSYTYIANCLDGTKICSPDSKVYSVPAKHYLKST